jgi:menaquinone-dependent protoporphyrinogen oxidase
MAVGRRTFVKAGIVAAGMVLLGGAGIEAATWAPEPELVRERTGNGMRKVLVTYATKSGSVSGIAERIGETLAVSGAEVDVKPVGDKPDVAAYDAVLVGSGVRMGSWHEAAKQWVAGNAAALKSKPVAFFTVGMTLATEPGKTAEVRAYTDPLIAETGVGPLDVGTFAGWFEPKAFSFMERTIMGAMKAPKGDHRDMQAVAAWAQSVAPKLGLQG